MERKDPALQNPHCYSGRWNSTP